MESRQGGLRGEQWGLGGQHYPTTRFLRPGGQGVPALDRLTRYTLGGFSLLSATSHLHDPSPTLLSLKREG